MRAFLAHVARPAVMAITIASTFVAPALANPKTKLHAKLAGAEEVPVAPSAGQGAATVTVDTALGQLCYSLKAKGSDAPTMAHVHKGAAGVAGPVAVPLSALKNGSAKGCATAPAEVLASIATNPAGYYVNVHTAAHPAGAMRGQLSK